MTLTSSSAWEPKATTLPFSLAEPHKYSFTTVVDHVKHDILVADAVYLPNSDRLFSHQAAGLKAMSDHKVIFIQGCRGSSKTWLDARYVLLEALRNKTTVVFTGPTYRQALIPFNYVLKFIYENPDTVLNELEGSPTTGGSLEAKIRFKNGSVIKALPMGSGERIRGERADILLCDEFFKMEKSMYKLHIVPFLLGHKAEGSIGPKLIMSTSAEFEDSYAYNVLTRIVLPNVVRETALVKADPTYQRKYVVVDWNIDDLKASTKPDGTPYELGQDVLDLMLEDANPEERAQALYNKWVGVSGQFMPRNLVDKMGSASVNVEFEAEEGYQYSLAVDVATSDDGDNFVIQVLKFLPNDKCALVNSYWDKGLSAEEMAWYIHQFNKDFHPEWIIMDKGGGGLFVLQALSKRKLTMKDGTEHTIERPLLEHNEYGKYDGDRKVILTKPADPMIQMSFAGDRSRAGEHIHSEDIFMDLLYNGFRQALAKDDIPFLIPLGCSENAEGDAYDRSEVKVLDSIRESVYQLRHLAIKYEELPDGTKQIRRSKLNRVPMYTWKNSKKDGAVSLCYGYIAYNLHFQADRGALRDPGPARVTPQFYDEWSDLRQLPEDPKQNYNPFNQQ